MTTATTTSVINHSTLAGYQAWVSEIITALFTSVGVTQTADTGQTTNGGSSVPGTGTAGGYVIGRFNDTLQSTQPIYFKLEFGTGTATTYPQMWITVGQGSNGSGTITGTLLTRCAVVNGAGPSSTTTSYVSRFCYNATLGFLGMVWKIGGVGYASGSFGGFMIFRDNNASGVSQGNSCVLICNSATTAASSASDGYVQIYSYLTSAVLTLPVQYYWAFWPFTLTSTTYSGQVQVAPTFFMNPVLFVSALLAIGLLAEIPIGSTVSMAIVGTTSITFLSVGSAFGANSATQIGGAANPSGGLTLLMPWE